MANIINMFSLTANTMSIGNSVKGESRDNDKIYIIRVDYCPRSFGYMVSIIQHGNFCYLFLDDENLQTSKSVIGYIIEGGAVFSYISKIFELLDIAEISVICEKAINEPPEGSDLPRSIISDLEKALNNSKAHRFALARFGNIDEELATLIKNCQHR
jgi:hypothetical protein